MFLLLLGSVFGICAASVGDASSWYRICTNTCVSQYNCPTDSFHALGWASGDCLRCRLSCMWQTVEEFERHGHRVPQFHGKWPFSSLDFSFLNYNLILQEPASVLFSLGNLYAVFHLRQGIMNGRQKIASVDRIVWDIYTIIGMTTWFSSAAFHARDCWITEYMDYFCAYAFVLGALYVSLLLTVPWLTRDDKTSWSKLLGLIMVATYIKHVYNMWDHFDYGYNMMCCISASIISSLLYMFYLFRRYRLNGRFSIADKLLFRLIIWTNFSVLFELLDFVPIFYVIDAHSLFHLCTIPIPFWFARYLFLKNIESEPTLDKLKAF